MKLTSILPTISLCLTALLIFSACKKSSSTSDYLTANINGTAQSFDIGVSSTLATSGNVTTVTTAGAQTATDSAAVFTLAINNQNTLSNTGAVHPITTGSYGSDPNNSYVISVAYITNKGNLNEPVYVANYPIASYADTSNYFTINVSSYTSSRISGTFSGKLYLYAAGSVDTTHSVTVTNGSFSTLILQ